MAEDDARARMAAQASDEQRRAVADEIVIENDGIACELAERGGRALALLRRVASAAP